VWFLCVKPADVRVTGAVKNPGTYQIGKSHILAGSLEMGNLAVEAAGGVFPEASVVKYDTHTGFLGFSYTVNVICEVSGTDINHLLDVLSSNTAGSLNTRNAVSEFTSKYGDKQLFDLLFGENHISKLNYYLNNKVIDLLEQDSYYMKSWVELLPYVLELDGNNNLTIRSTKSLESMSDCVSWIDYQRHHGYGTGGWSAGRALTLLKAFGQRAFGYSNDSEQVVSQFKPDDFILYLHLIYDYLPGRNSSMSSKLWDIYANYYLLLPSFEMFELVKFDPQSFQLSPDNLVQTMISLNIINAYAKSQTKFLEHLTQLASSDTEAQISQVGTTPTLSLQISGYLTRNVPIYDPDSRKWTNFDTWSKNLASSMSRSSSSSQSQFNRDPIGGTISILQDSSPDNIKNVLGLK
jgi:hypothetical protein